MTTLLRTKTIDDLRRLAPAIFAEKPKDTVSDKYLFIPTISLVENLLKHNFSILNAKQQRSRVEGNRETNKHVISFVQSGVTPIVGNVFPVLNLTNSHNGLSSFSLSAGMFRLACSNGMTVPQGVIAYQPIKHSINVDKETIEASYKVIQDFPKIAETVEEMQSIQLNQDEKLLLAKTAAQLTIEPDIIAHTNAVKENLIELDMLRPNRYDDARKNDLWTTFNNIQENIIKGNIRVDTHGDRQVRFKRKITSIDKDKQINDALFTLANEFRKLKRG